MMHQDHTASSTSSSCPSVTDDYGLCDLARWSCCWSLQLQMTGIERIEGKNYTTRQNGMKERRGCGVVGKKTTQGVYLLRVRYGKTYRGLIHQSPCHGETAYEILIPSSLSIPIPLLLRSLLAPLSPSKHRKDFSSSLFQLL